MNPVNKSQIKIIHTLLNKAKLMDSKLQIVHDISLGRVESTKDLWFDEAAQLINFLQQPFDKLKATDPRQRMINSIIAMAHEMGWIGELSIVNGGGLKKKKDYSGLHAWVEKYGYLKKRLNAYNEKELPTLVTQMQQVYSGWLRK
jgi:hypothetical protein